MILRKCRLHLVFQGESILYVALNCGHIWKNEIDFNVSFKGQNCTFASCTVLTFLSLCLLSGFLVWSLPLAFCTPHRHWPVHHACRSILKCLTCGWLGKCIVSRGTIRRNWRLLFKIICRKIYAMLFISLRRLEALKVKLKLPVSKASRLGPFHDL